MKLLSLLLLIATVAAVAAEPQTFTASRSVQKPFSDVKAAVVRYCALMKQERPSIAIADAREDDGKLVQPWWDCAGAPPGALTGEIIVTREPGPLTSTRIEVRTGATREQSEKAATYRQTRTDKVLEEIVALMQAPATAPRRGS